jgi:DNA invertase Pin-like site-specific DNA recombinase
MSLSNGNGELQRLADLIVRREFQDDSDLIPAVGYLRRSTDKQEASLLEQRRAIEEYAKAHGYRIIRWYTDDAIRGDATAKRLAVRRMLQEAQDPGDFQAILVWDQDRCGRFSPHEASYWTFPLAQAGVQLVTTDRGPIDWNDFVQWLTYSVTQHGKHQFLKDLSRNVARGQLEAAKNGGWLGSPPYAYRLEGPRKARRPVPDDLAKVRVVQRIFREYVEEGRPMMAIADRLNRDRIPSPGGAGGRLALEYREGDPGEPGLRRGPRGLPGVERQVPHDPLRHRRQDGRQAPPQAGRRMGRPPGPPRGDH